MFDGWSATLEDLTARRFLHMHRDGRRCWQCDPDGRCRMLTWAVDYFAQAGDPVPGQATEILARAAHPDKVTAEELREVAQTLRGRMADG
ncbi:hypothetical protein ABNF97_09470 [Plantactinospora sp. B6F1]|uniref:hypothetical protein n=1 Tax=Plantactinospora sp. B6F1 TaxID=3158971 RepID=UPI0032D9207F